MMEEATSVPIHHFLRHFEFQLAKCLAEELRGVAESLSLVFRHLKTCRNLEKEKDSQDKQRGASGSHEPKLNKVAESIESIFSQFGTYPPVLPHAEFIDDFVLRIRKKLKAVENTGGNTSRSGGKPSRCSPSDSVDSFSNTMISHINAIFAEVENLENLKAKQLLTCQYLSEIKSCVHTPLKTVLKKYDALPPHPIESNEAASVAQAFEAVESQYNSIRSNAVLVKVVTLKVEAEFIESKVQHFLKPLRDAAAVVVQQKEATAQQCESVWSRSLLPLLACPTAELLARCCHKTIMENFASSLVELQAVLKNTSGDTSSPQHERLFGGISDETVAGIKKFDIELFAAHLDDWRMRVCEIENQSNSSDFSKSYKELTKARLNLKKAEETYERKMCAIDATLESYCQVFEEMKSLAHKLEETCLTELKAQIKIILPEKKRITGE